MERGMNELWYKQRAKKKKVFSMFLTGPSKKSASRQKFEEVFDGFRQKQPHLVKKFARDARVQWLRQKTSHSVKIFVLPFDGLHTRQNFRQKLTNALQLIRDKTTC